MINTGAMQVKISPLDEWKNIFYEAWRVNRDYFYDSNMHGVS
jgi:tricorn protease